MAGPWSRRFANRAGNNDSSVRRLYSIVREFTSDAADATVETLTEPNVTQIMGSIDVEFGVAPDTPTSVQVILKTIYGVTLETSPVYTASGRFKFNQPQEIVDGFMVSVVCVGNSKIATIVFNVW